MPGGDSEFQRLLERVQAGREDAVTELIEVYGPLILQVTRKLLDRQLRSRFDSQDFVQSVWASVFGLNMPWQQFGQPNDLMGFLTTLARNKVVEEFRQQNETFKRGSAQVRSLDQAGRSMDNYLAGRHPSPSQIAVAKERWERLLAEQPERYRDILHRRYEGETYSEIAARLGLHESTVRRIVERMFRDHLEDDSDWDTDEGESA